MAQTTSNGAKHETCNSPISIDHLVRISRAPDGVKRAAKLVEAITLEPVQFFKDASVYLGLKYGLSQINIAKTTPDAHQAAGTLWAVAMKVEYGERLEALQKLNAAKDALKQAIETGADGETIDKLVQELKEAIEGAIESSLGMTASKKAPKSPEQRAAERKEAEREIDLLLEEIKSAAKRNDKGEAQKALDELGKKTDEMTAQKGEPGEQEQAGEDEEPDAEQQQGQQPEQSGKDAEQKSQEALEQLGQAMDEQKSLADQTFQKAQDGGGAGGDAMAKEQGDIAGKLAEAAGKAGDKPGSQSLTQAGKAMRDAQQALAKGDYGKAMGMQAQAIDKMREGAAALSSSLKGQSAKGKTGQTEDPLGRQPGSGQDGGKGTNIPDYAERQRSQEILDEIKRRAARADSDPVEKSYLERLLERF